MSDYEHKAWLTLLEAILKEPKPQKEPGRISNYLEKAKSTVSESATQARDKMMAIPKAEETVESIGMAVDRAMKGLHSLTVDFGLNSVNTQKVVTKFMKHGYETERFEDILLLDLRACDRVLGPNKQRYTVVGVAEGAASSLAVTGLTVSSTVSGGVTLGAAVTAVAADAMTVLAGMGRIVADVAAHYGFDVREPEESLFAAGVLSYSTAKGASERAAALSSLSRLTQTMMRRTTMKQLSQNHLVRVIERVFKMLGFKLTRGKLAQAVPVAGAVINGGMNAKLARDTFNSAHEAYRLRFLTEKYGLDAEAWRPDARPYAAENPSEVPLVDEILEAELVSEDVIAPTESKS
ncbi:EcsC family protein [Corynebacterium halotolerans]|nr:EcsC family protein [Corynebacterium halotolerans]